MSELIFKFSNWIWARPLALQKFDFTLDKLRISLIWIIRLRWILLFGVGLIVAYVANIIDVEIAVTSILLGIIAISNIFLLSIINNHKAISPKLITLILVVDPILLTALFLYTGGPTNPFTSFYLVYVVIAVLAISSNLAILTTIVCVICYIGLFTLHVPLHASHHKDEVEDHGSHNDEHGHDDHAVESVEVLESTEHDLLNHTDTLPEDYRMQGILASFILTAGALGYFITKLNDNLEELDRELSETKALSMHSEKLAALASLSAGVAHEVGTPLGTIAVTTNEIQRTHLTDSDESGLVDDIKLIRAEVDRCKTIINRLDHRFSKNIGEACQHFSLDDLNSGIREELNQNQNNQVMIKTNNFYDSKLFLPKITLVSSIVSLIKNSIDASRDNDPISVDLTIENDIFKALVKDKGSGIDEKILPSLGEPFITTKPYGHGMGLGVFLVKLFANRLNGNLQYQSDKDKGTVATLNLPVTAKI